MSSCRNGFGLLRNFRYRAMPTYEYKCEKCNKVFEKFQSMNDERLTTCPRELCQQVPWGEGKVKRLLGTGAGIIFKGSGFYSTDYRSSGYQEAAKKDSASQTPTPATESKPSKPSEPSKPAETSKPAASSSSTAI